MKKILLYLFFLIFLFTKSSAQENDANNFKKYLSCIDARLGKNTGYSLYGYVCEKDTINKKKKQKLLENVVVTLYLIKADSIKKYYKNPLSDSTLKRIGTAASISDGKFCLEVRLGNAYLINLQQAGYNPLNCIFNTRNALVLEQKNNSSKTILYNFSMEVATDGKQTYRSQNNTIFFDKDVNAFRVSRGKDYDNNKKNNISLVANNVQVSSSDFQKKITNKSATTTEQKSNLIVDSNGASAVIIERDTVNKIDIATNKQGRWFYFNGNANKNEGKKIFEGEYIDNLKSGKWINYYPNDSVALQLNFNNNMPTGDYKLYYQNGILKSDGKWNVDKFNGAFKFYNPTGNLIKDFDYDDSGKKTGKQMIYYVNGNLALLASMKNGILDGQTNVYLEDGSIYAKRNYQNGTLISEIIISKNNRVNKKICDTLVNELFKPDTSVINQLKTSLYQLDSIENKYGKLLETREAMLEEANITISTQQKELLLKQRKISKMQFEDELKRNEIIRQKQLFYFSLAVAFLLLIIIYVVIKNNVIKQKVNKELTLQKIQIQQKNTEILDSIEYAKRIQTAILPTPRVVKSFLKESYILYVPKDIVAGDFYWMENIDNDVYIAACDCTGHGVPGALVSVVCNNALNRSLNEFGERDTGKIFDKTRELVLENFSKSDDEVKDGMDASLLRLTMNERGNVVNVLWSGANNSLLVAKKQTSELVEYKANKQPIGMTDNPKPFTSHNIEVQDGDTFYLFTDGYADQFGGLKNKKFTKAKFKELLVSIANLPMIEQREALYNAHINWRGNNEQVDDICVIGVRV